MSNYDVLELGGLASWHQLEGAAPGKHFVDKDFPAQFIGMSVNSTEPGASQPFWHTHSVLEELYVFLGGEGQLALDGDVVDVTAGTVVRVGQGVWRALRCKEDSPESLKWLCIRAGGATLTEIGRDGELDKERPFPWTA